MALTIIKYNAGNIRSVLFALERIGIEAEVTDDLKKIQSADKVIFPGVGEASTAMHYLKERGLDAVIKNLKQPVLGICLGMQLMCRYSEENNTECLGIFEEGVRRYGAEGSGARATGLKVPQIGWNNIYNLKTDLFEGVKEKSFCYFVHSYYPVPIESSIIATRTDYGTTFASAIWRDNIYATQFHPEKSQGVGLQLLKNFISL